MTASVTRIAKTLIEKSRECHITSLSQLLIKRGTEINACKHVHQKHIDQLSKIIQGILFFGYGGYKMP